MSKGEIIMRKSAIWALVIGLGAASLALFGRWPAAAIIEDFRECNYWQQVHADADKESVRLQEAYVRSNARLTAKDRITQHIIEGRISVSEAGRQFARLPDPSPYFMAMVRQREPGKTDHERLCRHLIDYACFSCKTEIESEALRRRLTQELEASLPQEQEVSIDRQQPKCVCD
jgi:hypothetical protein